MRAFTLIEMMVTVSLIAIISAFTVVNLNFQRDDRKVEQEALEFYGALLYARSLAVSGRVFINADGDSDLDVPNGYGVSLFRLAPDETEYVIYADIVPSIPYSYDNPSETFNAMRTGTMLSDNGIGVELSGAMSAGAGDNFSLNIFFATPDGAIAFENGGTHLLIPGDVRIKFFSIADPAVNKVIVVKSTNQIYVE